MRVGILPLGRPTFDVAFANQKLTAMQAALSKLDATIFGSPTLLMDSDETARAVEALKAENIDKLLVLQVTFTDAAAIVAASNALQVPLSI